MSSLDLVERSLPSSQQSLDKYPHLFQFPSKAYFPWFVFFSEEEETTL